MKFHTVFYIWTIRIGQKKLPILFCVKLVVFQSEGAILKVILKKD